MLEIALSLAIVFFAIYLIGKWKIFRLDAVPVRIFQALFITKVLAAIALYLIYTRFFSDRSTADIFRYYDDSAIMYQCLLQHPYDFFRMVTGFRAGDPDLLVYYDAMRNWYNTDLVFNDGRTMIRVNAFLRLFSMGTYFPHAVVMCFLSMLGLTGIFRFFHQLAPRRDLLLLVIVYLLPSTLIWTSGVIKEAFLIFALGLLLYQLERYRSESAGRTRAIGAGLVFLLLLLTVKAYVFFLVLPLLVVAGWSPAVLLPKGGWIAPLCYVLYFVLLAALVPVITGHALPELLTAKQQEFYNVAQTEQAKSMVDIPRLTPDWGRLCVTAPGAFFSTLLLPLPWQAHNALMWLSVLENLFILGLLLTLLRAVNVGTLRTISAFTIACGLFGIAVFVLAGWVTPIIGALVRYKVPGLPFLLFFFASIAFRPWMDLGKYLPVAPK